MNKHHRPTALLLTLSATLVAAACAGSSTSPPATANDVGTGQASQDSAGSSADVSTVDSAVPVDSGPEAQDIAAMDAGLPDTGAAAIDASKPKPQITALDAPQQKPLPTFVAVKDTTGALVKPSQLTGKWTVIWFYPAAQTAG